FYDNALKDVSQITIPFRSPFSKHVFHQYTLQLSDNVDRDRLVEYLKAEGIPSGVYYPVPAHRQKMFSTIESTTKNMDNTEWLTSRVISLPMHTELEEDQLNYICKTLKNYLQ